MTNDHFPKLIQALRDAIDQTRCLERRSTGSDQLNWKYRAEELLQMLDAVTEVRDEQARATKYEGTTSWGTGKPDAKFTQFLLFPDRLSFEVTFDGTPYRGLLFKRADGTFYGAFTAVGTDNSVQRVTAGCVLLTDDGGETLRLAGTWIESRLTYQWSGDLERSEQ